jgi:hypothetical protein
VSARRSSFFFLACRSKVQILVDALHNGGLKAGDLVNFVQKIVELAVNGGSAFFVRSRDLSVDVTPYSVLRRTQYGDPLAFRMFSSRDSKT